MNAGHQGYFLPYQARWIADPSKLKICEKSRRIGMTYAQSYEDVIDASRKEKAMDIWFSSADESAAKEYIRYCAQWVRLLKIAAADLGEVVIQKEDDIKALVIELATGKRIHALSSNPKAFRSKGGKLILDEYAFHKQPEELWKAALPIITWGFPARILSTYNGKGNRYYRLVEDAKKVGSRWHLHSTNIIEAVDQGLADRITGRELTRRERDEWLAECREQAGDEETWQQEFLCNPIDEATAFLPWELIISAEHADAGDPAKYLRGPCFVGMDIGRRRDLTVIWVLEKVGDVYWTREVVRMKGKSFAEQDFELDRIFASYQVRRACIDQTGIGEKPVEDAKSRHGTYRIEGVIFTSATKQELATTGKKSFEDRLVRIPKDKAIQESHHSVRKVMTSAGNPRFDADRSEVGHADEYWAHMLAIHAAENPPAPIEFQTTGETRATSNMQDYLG
jgi:phage FluMu gp28-like protein